MGGFERLLGSSTATGRRVRLSPALGSSIATGQRVRLSPALGSSIATGRRGRLSPALGSSIATGPGEAGRRVYGYHYRFSHFSITLVFHIAFLCILFMVFSWVLFINYIMYIGLVLRLISCM